MVATIGTLDIWTDPYSRLRPDLPAVCPQLRGAGSLTLSNLQLKFHTPFLVYQRQAKNPGERTPDGKPRTNHQGRPILPAGSLHGALRAQAERILRTVGNPVEKGYEVPDVADIDDAGQTLDLAAALFGAPGWRSLVRMTDFRAPQGAKRLTHEMVAIDRITGGGKDSAEFTIEALDCPTLTGSLSLDLHRLGRLEQKHAGVTAQLLGLLAHVLRDLGEGDIPLGYGAAKGYGRSHSTSCDALEKALKEQKPAHVDDIGNALAAFAKMVQLPATSIMPGKGVEPEPAAPPLAPPTNTTRPLFHNPYVFIPFGDPKPSDQRLPWTAYGQIAGDTHHHSHARYAPGAFNGRLVCRLTTKTPIFVGAGDVPNTQNPKQKENFRLDGKIAPPAPSLRGMVSSLHEAITRASLRAMDDRTYSVRPDTGRTDVNAFAFSAIGRVHIRNGTIHIEPLTLPTLERDGRGQYHITYDYAVAFAATGMKDGQAFHKVLLENITIPPDSDFARSQIVQFTDERSRGYWYMPLEPLRVNPGSNSIHSGAYRITKRRFLIGQRPTVNGACPLSQEEYDQLNQGGYVRGFIRPMKYEGRQLPPPSVRKYELFVPFPVARDASDPITIPCTDRCIDRFEALTNERHALQKKELPTDERLRFPYTPVNHSRNGEPLRPSQGDLVFFKPSAAGNTIAEISYSSIWRARLETDEGAYKTQHALSMVQLSPLNDPDTSKQLSPSELLFGCIEQNSKEKRQKDAKKGIMAFASKVQFGYGHSLNKVDPLGAVTLKILSSPKPPSPAMYFQPRPDKGQPRYIKKAELVSSPEDFMLKGRKAYLHALRLGETLPNEAAPGVAPLDRNGGVPQGQNGPPPWQTQPPGQNAPNRVREDYNRANKQRVRVKPIGKDEIFFFEVDFVNLSQAELESLCASLSPHSTFEHKLGMGKPIGLGSVKIHIVGMYLVDRSARYRQTDFSVAARYAGVWKDKAVSNLPPHLRREQEANPTSGVIDPRHLANAQMTELCDNDKAVFNAILLAGNPNAVKWPVHYPQLNDRDIERETFAWFVCNDRPVSTWNGIQQFLESFHANSTQLPTLDRTTRTRTDQSNPESCR